MKRPQTETVARALLDAHVRFLVAELTGPQLPPAIARTIDGALADAMLLTLDDVVTRQMIKDTARTFASEVELSGGIPALIAEIARTVWEHKAHKHITLGELLPETHLRELVDKLLELKKLRERLIREAVHNPLYAAFASDLLYRGISGYLASHPLARGIPGARSVMKMGKRVLSKAAPGLEDDLRRYIGKSVTSIASKTAERLITRADDDSIRDAVLEFWSHLKDTPIAAFRRDVRSLDVEELFVILYEYWRDLRKTDYYKALIDAGIDCFFDRFGKATLREILDELGIGRDIMYAEAMRYLPPVIAALNEHRLLEPAIRRQLARFYESAEVRAILASV